MRKMLLNAFLGNEEKNVVQIRRTGMHASAIQKYDGFQAKAAQSLGMTDRSIRRSMKTDSR